MTCGRARGTGATGPTAKGPQITVTLNGRLVNTCTSTRQTAGFLALQMHDWPSRLQFRSLAVKKLP